MKSVKFIIELTLLISQISKIQTHAISSEDISNDDVQNYLTKFGYLTQSSNEIANVQSKDHLQEAIRNLQKFANIPITGILDSKTRKLIKAPRCGVPDFHAENFGNFGNQRVKRYSVHQQRWNRLDISWSLRIRTVSPQFDIGQVRRNIQKAFSIWSMHSKLNFREMNDPNADIQISFERGDHGDGYYNMFKGPGGVLAHAFYPGSEIGGDVHLDADETWLMNETMSSGTNMFQVALHELGHALGVEHSKDKNSIMVPWYNDKQFHTDLTEDDRLAIQQLYGSRDNDRGGRRLTTHRTTTRSSRSSVKPITSYPVTPKSDEPDTCNTSYDAVTIIRGELFIFKNQYLWRIGRDGLSPGYPYLIRGMWSELPENLHHINSVYENQRNQIVFFVGCEYYVFESTSLRPGYPKPLSNLGLPENVNKIDAALVWSYNNHTYLFSGNQYWKFDEDIMRVDLVGYPRHISRWQGIGENIDSAFQYTDGKTYFFKDKGYWQFDDKHMRVSHKDPRRSAEKWMGENICKDDAELRELNTYALSSSASTSLRMKIFDFMIISNFLIIVFCSSVQH